MGSALDLLKIKSCFNSICWVKSLTNILSKPYSTYRVKSLTLLKNESVLLICKNAFFAVQKAWNMVLVTDSIVLTTLNSFFIAYHKRGSCMYKSTNH